MVGKIGEDVQRLGTKPGTPDELVAGLLDIGVTKQPDVSEDEDPGLEY